MIGGRSRLHLIDFGPLPKSKEVFASAAEAKVTKNAGKTMQQRTDELAITKIYHTCVNVIDYHATMEITSPFDFL